MFDQHSESSKRVLEQIEKPNMRQRLRRIAFWSTRDLFSADDLVSDSVIRALDPADRPWNVKWPFLRFMTFTLRDTYKEQMRRLSAHEVPYDTQGMNETHRSDEPGPDEQVDADRHRRDLLAFHAKVGKLLGDEDSKLRRCFDLMTDEVSAEEQAAALEWTLVDVRNAHRKITRRSLSLYEDWMAEQSAVLRVKQQKAGLLEGTER